MYHDLKNQTIIITGITGGIALATAQLALKYDANLIVTARSQDKLDKALSQLSGAVSGYILDVSDETSVKNFFNQVGSFDHLVTPAATSSFSPISDLDIESTQMLINSKQWGQLFCVKYASQHIKKTGSITLFSGTVTQKVLPGATAFAAAGAATEASARIWALELAPIRVNTIVPGIIDTPIWEQLLGEAGAEEHLQNFTSALPVGRTGTSDDIAKTVLYLIDNGFVTGSSLVIDGGHRLI